MTKTIILFLAFVAMMPCFHSASAQEKPSDDDYIKTIVEHIFYDRENGFVKDSNLVGAAIGVYWKGKTYHFCYGWADKERGIKTDRNTRFEIGSNTKVFTGLMLSFEMAERKMSGNDFIDKYLTVNKGIQNKVHLTDLANHTSGLPTFHDAASLAELIAKDTTKDPLMMVTDAYVLSVLKKVDTLHNQGSYEYSNFAVGTLGYILQKKEKASYNELLQKMICKPMGMTHTYAAADTNNSKLARGYFRGQRSPFLHLCTAMQGAGAITSDIEDMTTFIKYQTTGHPFLRRALDTSHRKYYTGAELQLAMGWHVGQQYGSEIYEMRGDTYGASSAMLFDPKNELGIVILLNTADSRTVSNTQNKILASLLDTSGMQNKFSLPEIAVDRKLLDTYAGVYEIEPGADATVSIEGGKLALQITGQPKLAFKAVGANWFVMEKFNCQLEFIGNGSEHCKAFILHQNGYKVSCNRK